MTEQPRPSQVKPAQWSREDLDAATPAQVEAAHDAGQLADIMSGTPATSETDPELAAYLISNRQRPMLTEDPVFGLIAEDPRATRLEDGTIRIDWIPRQPTTAEQIHYNGGKK